MTPPSYLQEITYKLQSRNAALGWHYSGVLWSFIIFSWLLRKGDRNWLLTDSISGFRVDTIREPSDGSLGDQTSCLPTRHAVVFPGLSCGLKSFTNHVNKYPELRILWFFTPEYKDFAAFIVAAQIQHGPQDAHTMWKVFVPIKWGQLILMMQQAVQTAGSACLNQCVCSSEGVCLVWVAHTCFPVGWIWWRPQGTEQTDSSESSSEGVRYPTLHCCSCQACLAAMMGSRWTERQHQKHRTFLVQFCSASVYLWCTEELPPIHLIL